MSEQTLTRPEVTVTAENLSELFTQAIAANSKTTTSGDRHFKSGMHDIVETESELETEKYKLTNTVVVLDADGTGAKISRAQILKVKLKTSPTKTPQTGDAHVMHVSYEQTTNGLKQTLTKTVEVVDGHSSKTFHFILETPEQQTELLDAYAMAIQEAKE